VREAEAVGNKTAAEQLTIDRMKAAAAQRAGDMGTAIQALESIVRQGRRRRSRADRRTAGLGLRAAAQQRQGHRVGEQGHRRRQQQRVDQAVAGYLQGASGDYAAIARDAGAAVSAAEQAGRARRKATCCAWPMPSSAPATTPATATRWRSCCCYYPKKDYWNAHLSRLPRKPGFGDRFALDVMRLRLASGTLSKTEDFMEMAQLSLQAGLPAEGRRIVDQGYKAGLLGTGAEAARHQRLKDLAVKQEGELKAAIAGQTAEAEAQKDGNDLVKVGYAYVSLGEVDKGIALIEQGHRQGQA
jgi:hypothetical protein